MTAIVLRAVLFVASLFGIRLSDFAAGAIAAAMIVVGIAGGVSYITFSAYRHGVEKTEAKWQARALQSKLDAATADLAAARTAAADAALRAKAIEAQSQIEMEGVAEYVEELKKRAAPACLLTDADLRGLRAAGRHRPTAAKPAASARLLKAGASAARRAGH